MRGLTAVIIPKHDIFDSVGRHFTTGKDYKVIYETDPEDQGWFTTDDFGGIHWLSPKDGKDHMDIHRQPWIANNFIIVSVDGRTA
jgi:hypothetical protein